MPGRDQHAHIHEGPANPCHSNPLQTRSRQPVTLPPVPETEGTQDVLRVLTGLADVVKVAPQINACGDDFVLPDSRTWLTFKGALPADFPFDFQTNALVTGAVPIERSGPAAVTLKRWSSKRSCEMRPVCHS